MSKKMTLTLLAAAMMMALAAPLALAEDKLADGAPAAEKLGWRLATQAYSFNKFTFYEAVDKTAALGLGYIEAYPGQRLSKDMPENVVFDHNMPADLQKQVLAYLASKKVKLVNYGVVGLSKDEAESRKVFDFAKAMGIETIVSEPAAAAFPLVGKLCDEYGINMAIHNHPKPSMYWDYKKTIKALDGCTKRMGSCCDTGHWPRSGVNSLEALTAMADAGRIISLHFKDLNEFGNRDAYDVPWGTGVCDVKGMLTMLKAKNVKAVFSIEYEHNWDNSLPEIAQCVKNFDKFAQELSK